MLCKRVFTENSLVKRMWYEEDRVAGAVILHLQGNTEEDIADFLEISWRTVERWLEKFGALLDKLCSRFKPMHCNTLHMDELFLKMLGMFLIVWDSLVRETHWLTIVPTSDREAKSARKLLEKSPIIDNQAVTDGLLSYVKPIREKYKHKIKHLICEGPSKYMNNLIEGTQSVMRRFTRPRRGFKRIYKALTHLRRFQNYKNFIKDNLAIGMPPAQKYGFVQYAGGMNRKQRLLQLLRAAHQFFRLIKKQVFQPIFNQT
jgi:transposase-like protein